MIKRNCLICNKQFKTWKSENGKYCSRICFYKSKIGKPINKGHTPWNKGKKLPQFSGKNNPAWKGGKIKDNDGYILIYKPNHPFVTSDIYVRRNRLVMEKHLGRFLNPEEVVHHINGIVSDDRIENLMLFANNGKHLKYHNNLSQLLFRLQIFLKKYKQIDFS